MRDQQRVIGLHRECLGQNRDRVRIVLVRLLVDLPHCLKVSVVDGEAARSLTARALDLRGLNAMFDQHGDALGNPVLKVEELLGRPVELLCPKMRSGRSVDQLRRDS